MSVYIGEVKFVIDDLDGERIQARVMPEDKNIVDEKLPWAFPLLPKHLHVKPKPGEAVFIICADDNQRNSQRFYVGPIISQPQFLYQDSYVLGATRLLRGGQKYLAESALSNKTVAVGAQANDQDIAIYGRKDTDIILTDNDVRIRCGCRKSNEYNSEDITFNKRNPTFIKMKEHDKPFNNESQSTMTLVSEEINLISTAAKEHYKVYDPDGQITDEGMQEIIDKAHCLPYGDVLVDFLTMFLQMFKSHTHKYHNLPPCPDSFSENLDKKYGSGGVATQPIQNGQFGVEDTSKTFAGLGSKLLNPHVRIG